jgi:hypothetical protein
MLRPDATRRLSCGYVVVELRGCGHLTRVHAIHLWN